MDRRHAHPVTRALANCEAAPEVFRGLGGAADLVRPRRVDKTYEHTTQFKKTAFSISSPEEPPILQIKPYSAILSTRCVLGSKQTGGAS